MTGGGFFFVGMWLYCTRFRNEYANAATKHEQEAILRRVVRRLHEDGLYIGKTRENGGPVLEDDEGIGQVKSYFDAPEVLKDIFKELFQKLGAQKGCKVFDFLATNSMGDMCVFIIF